MKNNTKAESVATVERERERERESNSLFNMEFVYSTIEYLVNNKKKNEKNKFEDSS